MGRLLESFLTFARGERPGGLWTLLAPLGGIASMGTWCRNFCYDHGLFAQWEMPLPVISVGNLTLGGTNKTPFVAAITETLLAAELAPGIVSRGYGGSARGVVLVQGGKGERSEVGDEPLLLSKMLPTVPVAVATDKIRGVTALRERGCRIVVADDAFQHRRMGRDADIVLIDATCPFGNGRHFPAGILREHLQALERASLVVITKADQISQEILEPLEEGLEKVVPRKRLFRSSIVLKEWFRFDEGEWRRSSEPPCRRRAFAFSAIGSPRSFIHVLEELGIKLVGTCSFRDHHHYTAEDLAAVEARTGERGAEILICTEKDTYNLPAGYVPSLPLWYPRVGTVIENPLRFWQALKEILRPKIIVASNGYGEDAIGALLAARLRERFPGAAVSAFALVGHGAAYLKQDIPVCSPPVETPSGGIVKYSWREFARDLRGGLLTHIGRQLRRWGHLRGRIRSVLCVGDVYLLLQVLAGQGQVPLLLATAKSVHLGGHWRIERFLLRYRARRVWTRDEATLEQLLRSRVAATYGGNPIMDLVEENILGEQNGTRFSPKAKDDGVSAAKPHLLEGASQWILLLPGSRLRAYEDVALLLATAECLGERCVAKRDTAVPRFLLVVAPTLESPRLVAEATRRGWAERRIFRRGRNVLVLEKEKSWGRLSVELSDESVAKVASGARLVIGLGGTANQICAGLGVPVVSILEKGKLVQKKLLRDAEVLVPPSPEDLSEAAERILEDATLHAAMSDAGRRAMGRPGALGDVETYAAECLGWALRHDVYKELCAFLAKEELK